MCSVCCKDIDSDYKETHRKQKHSGNPNVKFMTVLLDKNQTQLGFMANNRQEVQKTDSVIIDGMDYELTSDHIPGPSACDSTSYEPEQTKSTVEVIRSIPTDTGDKFDASAKNSEEDDDVESVDDRVDVKIDVESVIDADGPMQPKQDKYAPRKFSTETFERDFQADWCTKYSWLGYSVQNHTAYCYPCQQYS